MNIFEKIIGSINFSWKGNNKKVSTQKNGQTQVQQESGSISNIYNINIESISVADIKALVSTDSKELNSANLRDRFLAEQMMRQGNLSSVIKKSTLDEFTNSDKLEKDWFLKWIDVSQEVSREEVQEILAKIVRGEIKKPGTFSSSTLEKIRSIGKKELDLFKKIVDISISNNCIITLGHSILSSYVLDKYNISYNEFLVLTEAGLISFSNSSKVFSLKKDDKVIFDIGGEKLTKIVKKDNDKLLIPALLLTIVGQELAPLVNGENDKKAEYVKDLDIYLDSIL